MRSVERGICPIATLYSLAAAYKRVGANRAQLYFTRAELFCPKIRSHGTRGWQARNLNDDAIG